MNNKSVKKGASLPLANVLVEGEKVLKENEQGSIQGPAKSDAPYRLFGLLVIFVTFILLLGWAAFAPLDSAVVASGRVIVASQNKMVQHLDGGIVSEILVKDGDLVNKGDTLLKFDRTQLDAQLDNIQGQLWEAELDIQRLSAERDGKQELIFSDQDSNNTLDGIKDTKQQLFKSRRRALVSQKEVLDQRLSQSQKQIRGYEEKIASLKKRRVSLNKDIVSVRSLALKNMFPKHQVRELERELEEIDGDISSNLSEISRLYEVISETKHQKVLTDDEYLKEVAAHLSEKSTRRIQLLAEKRKLKDKLARIEVAAPVDGKVKDFNIVTTGAVVSSGSPIMEIVPSDQEFKVTAQLLPVDIDQIQVGLEAEIRFSVFNDAQFFPVMHADLTDVSTDTLVDEVNQYSYYKATLKLRRDSLKTLENEGVELISGMPAEVMILVGERTLLDYLIRPIARMIERSFNET